MPLILMLLLALPVFADTTVFQWQDDHGNQHYSDRTHPDAQPLTIKSGYGFSAVKTVYDGDTLVLDDGRKVRLLGINTPEVQHHNQSGEAGGEEAKQWLINALKHTTVRLEIGNEKTDKYGRTLAHVFTEQKVHINLQLVAAGLAAVSIYPTNLLYVNELLAAQERAERAGLGIWKQPAYQPIKAAELDKTADVPHQWLRIRGQVSSIHYTKKYVYLAFTDHFDARIERDWLYLFPDLNTYLNKHLEVRGWLNQYKNHRSMLIRHPSAIKWL